MNGFGYDPSRFNFDGGLMRKISLLVVCLLAGLQACDSAPAAKPTTVPVAGPQGVVNFLAMGDWGSGSPKQKIVAETLASYAQKQGNIQAVVLAGDNFYMKLSGVDDPVWKTVFEDVYDSKRLNMPFFAVLGNHDYQENKAQIELDYAKKNPTSRWKMPARWYRVNIPQEKPLVALIMLDSTKDKFSASDWAAQMEWMDKELASVPEGVWKVCVAHHTLFSNGSHGDNGVLQAQWGPILNKNHVDFFVCGHDHDVQHLEIPGWPESFVLVGGGGAGTRKMLRDQRGPFSKSLNGFGHFQFTPEKALVRLIGADGNELHAFERSKAGAIKILANMPNDKATTQPLKEIQGIGGNKNDD
jgi:tartrate-resistant acid phosphatase type 5